MQSLESSFYSEYKCFVRYVISEYSLSVCNLNLLCLNGVFPTENVFNFEEVQFINISFYG